MSAAKTVGLLAYVPSFKGERALVLNCDSISLTYLIAQLDAACIRARLDSMAVFKIGNHQPILSDGLITLKIKINHVCKNSNLIYKIDTESILELTLEAAIDMGNKLRAMANYSEPCHQFFTFQDSPLALVVTIGEYSDDDLRSMRGYLTNCS
jgi:hypothetical protein